MDTVEYFQELLLSKIPLCIGITYILATNYLRVYVVALVPPAVALYLFH